MLEPDRPQITVRCTRFAGVRLQTLRIFTAFSHQLVRQTHMNVPFIRTLPLIIIIIIIIIIKIRPQYFSIRAGSSSGVGCTQCRAISSITTLMLSKERDETGV